MIDPNQFQATTQSQVQRKIGKTTWWNVFSANIPGNHFSPVSRSLSFSLVGTGSPHPHTHTFHTTGIEMIIVLRKCTLLAFD